MTDYGRSGADAASIPNAGDLARDILDCVMGAMSVVNGAPCLDAAWALPQVAAMLSVRASDPPGALPIPSARQMQMQWHTEAGVVLFYYPSNLSAQDVEDVRALLDLALKGMDRRASAIEARRATTPQSGVVEDESAVAESETPNPSQDQSHAN